MVVGCGMSYDDPQLGDVIMGRAGDLDHPVFLKDRVSPNYYVFGAVRGFCYIRKNLRYHLKIDCGDKYYNER